jgi:ENT domain
LEAYSTVMSTFRAQGMLNDKKKRLLDELRSVFHIPPDRHKAEARRVANDEKLCTIAEV